MIGNDGGGGKDIYGAEFRWQVIPKTWCSDGYGSVGEHEMRSDSTRIDLHEQSLKING